MENILLDGSLSYDPEAARGDQSGMNFTWHYGEITGNYSSVQGRKRGFFIAVNESAFKTMEEHLACQFTWIQRLSLSDIYIVKLVVAKDYRNASAYQSQFFFTLFAECFPLSSCYLPVCSYELRVHS